MPDEADEKRIAKSIYAALIGPETDARTWVDTYEPIDLASVRVDGEINLLVLARAALRALAEEKGKSDG